MPAIGTPGSVGGRRGNPALYPTAIVDAECMYLTTTGRRSGAPRQIEIWFTRVDGRYYVVAEHGERTQCVRNIRGEPRVRLRVGEAIVAAAARVLDPTAEPDLHAAVQGLSREKYGWGDGLIVELVPLAG